jgi:hypothetical protein
MKLPQILARILLVMVLPLLLACSKPAPDAETSQNIDSLSAGSDDLNDELALPHENELLGIWADGKYPATVDLLDPKTGKLESLAMEVEVQGGEVIRLLYPGGASLDGADFEPVLLDVEGFAELETETGKLYKVQLER